MPSEVESKLREISNTVNDTSASRSKQDFNDFVKSFVGNNSEADPNNLDETIKTYTDRFDRLKFLFLEQEAKERFMRLVLEQETKIIDRDEVLKSMSEGEELKKALDDKKVKIADVSKDITTSSYEIHDLITEINHRKDRIEELIKELEEKDQKVGKIKSELELQSSQDPTKAEISRFQQKNPSLGYDIDSLGKEELLLKIKEVKARRAELADKTTRTHKEKEELISYMSRNAQRREQLMNESQKFDSLINNIKKIQGDQAPTEQRQQYLQKEKSLRVLIEIWKKISDIEYFRHDDNKITFKLRGHSNEVNVGLEGEKVSSLVIEGFENSKLRDIARSANESQDTINNLMSSIRSLLK